MGIYRGPGGSGDATNDASSETRLAVEARDAAIAAQVAAELAETNAAASAASIDTDNLVAVADIGVTVQAYDADLTSWASKTAPSGAAVGTTDTQTITNKTIELGSNTISGTLSQFNTAVTDADLVSLAGTETLTNKTLTSPVLTTATTSGKFTFGGAIDETVFAVTGTTPALSPSNGTIQTWTLSGNSTPTQGTWVEGESMTLMINDGTAFTVTWTSVPITWVGGTAPTLATTGFTVIELWEVGTTVYGALVGNVA